MRISYTLLYLLLAVCAIAQNWGFEQKQVTSCRQTGNENGSPFNDNLVQDWFASHGSPQLNLAGCAWPQNDIYKGSAAAFIHYEVNGSNREGIFREQAITKDESFNISIFAKGFSSNARLIVKLVNGLSNEPSNFGSGGPSTIVPTPSSFQLIFDQVLSNSWQEVRLDEIIADADYSQVWIYSMDGTILVDDFSFYKSCCEPYKLWQNITNPPSTYVNNYIKAGENVDVIPPQGKVVINEDAGLVEFQAGKNIELLPGFETEAGATFVAEIKDCGEKEFTLTVEEIPLRYSNSDPVCFKRFQASACFGSGDYTYFWSSSSGEDVSYPNDETSTTDIPITAPQWLYATVVDNMTGDTIKKGIHLAASPFSGLLEFDFGNIITPDGNGINDEWYVIDSTKLGKDSFGYNAFSYNLEIRKRYSNTPVYSASGLDKIKGFSFNEIKWIEDYCNFSVVREYLCILQLSNCSEDITITFGIEIMCPANAPYSLNIDTINKLETMNGILLFPNPSEAVFTIESKTRTIKTLMVYDGSGKTIRQSSNPDKLADLKVDLSEESAGVYRVEIEFTDGIRVIRTIVKQ